MTNRWLATTIRRFNAGKLGSYCAVRRLSETVMLANVWDQEPTGRVSNERSHKLYFVLDGNQCVGVVDDMVHDLHWLILRPYRKMGHLHRALRYILPHILSDGRPAIVATANTEKRAEYAIRQGFQRITPPPPFCPPDHIYLQLDAADVDIAAAPKGENSVLEKARLKELVRRLLKAKGLIRSVYEEVESALGSDAAALDNLDYLANAVDSAACDLALSE